jgi:hypothetical protein
MPSLRNFTNDQANEDISKFKMLSSYGGPGSIIHTSYGSIIISCIEEWGFIKKVSDLHGQQVIAAGATANQNELRRRVINLLKLPEHGSISISNDTRLLLSLIQRKKLPNLEYLVIAPDIELNEIYNKIKDRKANLAINSSFFPKYFLNDENVIRKYNEWYRIWRNHIPPGMNEFAHVKNYFPPSFNKNGIIKLLKQDNLTLICNNGHISDFPWSRYLRWKIEGHYDETRKSVDLIDHENCCIQPVIKILSINPHAAGFEGKLIKCENCKKQASLKGIMNLRVKCKGHKHWEAQTYTNEIRYYDGNPQSRDLQPPYEKCGNGTMQIALTTANNLYFSRVLSSLYIPECLLMDDKSLQIENLKVQLEVAINNRDFQKAGVINEKIESLQNELKNNDDTISERELDARFRYQEYNIFCNKTEDEINIEGEDADLYVKDVTCDINDVISPYFFKVLRIDNLKLTSVQLDFTRVEPVNIDAPHINSMNIFRSKSEQIRTYPAIENFGEGIFFAFSHKMIDEFDRSNGSEKLRNIIQKNHENDRNEFSKVARNLAKTMDWQLYLVHTFTHLLMRELEFRCGYPTASLSERLYIWNEENHKMYGMLIYTAEGNEGSMGGLIAQTSRKNLNDLILSALKRAEICNSDPLCWESDGQGLFDLNHAACFSCAMVSETSCEHRNIYLDRRILVDPNYGFFKDIIR